MDQIVNPQLEEETFRIVCPKCGKFVTSGYGNPTTATLTSMQYRSQECANCGHQYVIEINPITPSNKYDKEHQYPDNELINDK